jgi:hypothetical protein
MASAVSQRGTFLRPTFYRLPTEVIFYVFCWLTAKDIIGLRRVRAHFMIFAFTWADSKNIPPGM